MVRRASKIKQQPRGEDVVRKIVAGGLRVFLQSGYAGTSVDAIATLTRTSKATIYRHFADKEALFTAIVRHAYQTQQRVIDFRLDTPGSIRAALIDFGKRWIEEGMAPTQVRLARIIAFEIGRFPEIEAIVVNADQGGSGWYMNIFAELGAKDILPIYDAARAAATFSSLIGYPILLQSLFRPSMQLKSGDIELLVERGVDDFLLIYPPSKHKRSTKSG